VRNITDAGHLEGDMDEGDDKFAKKAKLEQLEPMEIVQKYTMGFRDVMRTFNTLPPSIEPTATGHISEQIEMIKQILEKDFAYEINGTVYFDVEKYSKEFPYGQLTNRKLEDLLEGTRELGGQDEKRGRLDFALWIVAKPETLMKWPSPWGWGFPGWHIECSAMSRKYLGDTFDIHGGGMDLQATHHTNEIAQSQACNNKAPVNYWMHTNMLTVNGVRMSKSAGNGFLPNELFTGNHPLLEKGYSPMAVRFFMLQSHYRSTLDFSNEALQASEKGLQRLMAANRFIDRIKPADKSTVDITDINRAFDALNDDFNSSVAIAVLFDWVRNINLLAENKETITEADLNSLRSTFRTITFDILGLKDEQNEGSKQGDLTGKLIEMLLNMRLEAKANKDFATSDRIRNEITQMGVTIRDRKDGFDWEIA
jgi:cysteinyl-tRNA synthetase